jgi:hypothetical protein
MTKKHAALVLMMVVVVLSIARPVPAQFCQNVICASKCTDYYCTGYPQDPYSGCINRPAGCMSIDSQCCGYGPLF